MRTDSPEVRTSRSTGLMLATIVVGVMAAILDTTIVAIGLPTIARDLNAGIAAVQWVSTAYLLAMAVSIPFVGWAQGHLGSKRVWIFALGLFLVGSLLCALAWNIQSLIVFRAVQGIGGGIMFPLMQTIVMQNVSPGDRVRSMATMTMATALGPVLAPILGGIILNWLTWEWMFLVNLPLGIVGLVMAVRYLPGRTPAEAAAPAPRLDLVGAALLVPGLAVTLYGLSNAHSEGGFGRADVAMPVVAGVVLLAAFSFWVLRRAAEPLVDIGLLRLGSLRASTTVMMLAGGTIFAAGFLLPLYFQEFRGNTALGAALLLIPQGVGAVVARFFMDGLVSRFGPRLVTIGAALVMLIGTVPFLWLGADTGSVVLGGILFVRGLGVGAVLIPAMATAFDDVAKPDMPQASAISRIAQQVGGSFATAVTAVAVGASVPGAVPHFTAALWILVVIAVLTGVAALLIPGRAAVAAGAGAR